jgi:hypothetical protein
VGLLGCYRPTVKLGKCCQPFRACHRRDPYRKSAAQQA